MNDDELDRLLTIGQASTTQSPEILDSVLARLSRDAREQAALRGVRKRTRRWVPLAGITVFVGIAAATAGAFYAEPSFVPDVTIPIVYVTDTGRTVECTYSLVVRTWDGADGSALTQWVSGHDWARAEVGQRGYDYAVANPIAHGDPGVESTISEEELERSSVSRGISTVIHREIPEDLIVGPGVGTGATSTCRWDRH